MNPDKIKELQIPMEAKSRSSVSIGFIFLGVLVLAAVAAFFAWPREEDSRRILGSKSGKPAESVASSATSPSATGTNNPTAQRAGANGIALTVSGYIINHERIELSPRFMGVVKWIGVAKGDSVTNGQVLVLLDDAEYKARVLEVEGRLASARVAVEKAELDFGRITQLAKTEVESRQALDDARLRLESSKASVKEIQGQYDLANTYLDWTVIRAPINGVVLEKLVEPNELVVPQSFGGTRGPSTALLSLADLKDLQVEIDLNEADLAKVSLKQACRISPEAYPDKNYEGYVAEIAPEANRQKGTLQIKVQILNPDRYLTPELSAKVDFLNADEKTVK